MDNLIDKTYFLSGVTKIPNLEHNNGFDESLQANKVEELNKCIAINQEFFFRLILGNDLYDEFAQEPDNPKWNNMKSKLINSDKHISPLANYVFVNYINENLSQITQTGAVITKKDNMTAVSPVYLMKPAWNQMCDMMSLFFYWFKDNYSELETENLLSCDNWGYLTEYMNTFGI